MSKITTADQFYAQVDTAVRKLTPRLKIFVEEYRSFKEARKRPLRVLDVGCGRVAFLSAFVGTDDLYCGCDIVPLEEVELPCYRVVDLNSPRALSSAFGDEPFDVVFCGEVLEHVFSPDALVEELKSVLRDDGLLILSTPNLGYWVNRLLLLVGISPLFVENSAERKLGRRFRWLGKGNVTEGHIRLFTYRAMRDMAELHGLRLLRTRSAPVWNFPPDRIVSRLSPSLGPVNTYMLTKSGADDRPALSP